MRCQPERRSTSSRHPRVWRLHLGKSGLAECYFSARERLANAKAFYTMICLESALAYPMHHGSFRTLVSFPTGTL